MSPIRSLLLLLACSALACAPGDERERRSPPNVVLLVADALRADALGVYGAPKGRSPEIDRLAEHALVAETAFAQAPWTPPSMASLFTGAYSSTHGVLHGEIDRGGFNVLAEDFTTLAELFRAGGYQTAAFSAQRWVNPELGFGQGFDEFEFVSSINDRHEAERVALAALGWIAGVEPRPFFVLLNFLDPHDPYDSPEPFGTRFVDGISPPRLEGIRDAGWKVFQSTLKSLDDPGPAMATAEEVRYLRDLYAGDVLYLDWWVGVVMRRLEEKDLLDRTLVVLVSDHGESFMEHGRLHHTTTVYNENLRVPFLISNPQRFAQPLRIAGPVELIDLYPTLAELAGLEVPDHVQGSSLLSPDGAGDLACSEGYVLEQLKCQNAEWSAVLTPGKGSRARLELFDLLTDPAEQHDLAAARPELAQEFRSRIRDRYRRNLASPWRSRSRLGRLPGEDLEQLRALGYIQ